MPLFKRRSREPPTMLGYWLRSSGDCPVGYHRLLDTPEVAACISRISAIISSVPIYLMENTRKGDVRVHDGLSRLVDIDPWPGMATRSGWTPAPMPLPSPSLAFCGRETGCWRPPARPMIPWPM